MSGPRLSPCKRPDTLPGRPRVHSGTWVPSVLRTRPGDVGASQASHTQWPQPWEPHSHLTSHRESLVLVYRETGPSVRTRRPPQHGTAAAKGLPARRPHLVDSPRLRSSRSAQRSTVSRPVVPGSRQTLLRPGVCRVQVGPVSLALYHSLLLLKNHVFLFKVQTSRHRQHRGAGRGPGREAGPAPAPQPTCRASPTQPDPCGGRGAALTPKGRAPSSNVRAAASGRSG